MALRDSVAAANGWEMNEIKYRLRRFATAREWDQFHSPKNLVLALIAEVGELAEQFQWLTDEQSVACTPEKLQLIEEELADVFLYLVRLSDKLNIDLIRAAHHKIDKNEEKYPVGLVRGSSKKYTEY